MAGTTDLNVLHPRPGAAVIECVGEHDITSKDQFASLQSELVVENELVVVDVSDAEFIDSSFVSNLFKGDRLARQHGSRLRLQHRTEVIVLRALEVSGALARLDGVSTREEALAPVGGNSPGDEL